MRLFGAKKVAVSTAYSKVVNDKLTELLEYNGFEVQALECFGITDFGGGATGKSEQEIIELTGKAIEKAPKADAVLISCGGLRTLNCSDADREALRPAGRDLDPVGVLGGAAARRRKRAAFRLWPDAGGGESAEMAQLTTS